MDSAYTLAKKEGLIQLWSQHISSWKQRPTTTVDLAYALAKRKTYYKRGLDLYLREKRNIHYKRGLGLCLGEKRKAYHNYRLGLYLQERKKTHHNGGRGLLLCGTTSVEASIVSTISQQDWRDACVWMWLPRYAGLCFRDDCWRTKMNFEKRIDGDEDGEERDSYTFVYRNLIAWFRSLE